MNRRAFLGLLGIALPGAGLASKLTLPTIQRATPKKFGNFEIADDGTMSLDGLTRFPVYGPDGGLSFATASYRYANGAIFEVINNPQTGETQSIIWTETRGGVF